MSWKSNCLNLTNKKSRTSSQFYIYNHMMFFSLLNTFLEFSYHYAPKNENMRYKNTMGNIFITVGNIWKFIVVENNTFILAKAAFIWSKIKCEIVLLFIRRFDLLTNVFYFILFFTLLYSCDGISEFSASFLQSHDLKSDLLLKNLTFWQSIMKTVVLA